MTHTTRKTQHTTHTIEEKRAYFASLRQRWTDAKKKYSESELGEARAFIKDHALSISPYSFMFVQYAMRAQGFSGIPYLDCKTYRGWQECGFQVRKGERSTISGITWIGATGKKTEGPDAPAAGDDQRESAYLMPKEYHLFHRSQVSPTMAAALDEKQGELL